MTDLKIIRNGKGFNYTVFSPNARGNDAGYHLDFNPLVNYFKLGYTEGYIIQHYNKFEKSWGFVKSATGAYKLIKKDKLNLLNSPVFLLLPDDYQPSALIRGVLLYDDDPNNPSVLPSIDLRLSV